ncbi:rhomboid family intramembrane serine protease [Oricola sp.]|uniref:rhomboid family intramembrane serine protease n=1 Tax=Oricola sp. TaxID=1979950 RepID=UPI003BAC3734
MAFFLAEMSSIAKPHEIPAQKGRPQNMTTPENETSHDETGREAGPGSGTGRTPQPVFNLAPVIVVVSLICVAVHLLRGWISTNAEQWLFVHAAFFPLRYRPDILTLDMPTLFSPVTYAFLHGVWTHLGLNLVWLAVFGSPVAFRIGGLRSLLFWLVTAAFAALTHLIVYYGSPVPVIGASGAVSGFLGAAARYGLRANRAAPRRGFDGPLLSIGQTLNSRRVFPFLAVWVILNIAVGSGFFGFFGESPGIAWEAHLGGLAAGFLLIGAFDHRRA